MKKELKEMNGIEAQEVETVEAITEVSEQITESAQAQEETQDTEQEQLNIINGLSDAVDGLTEFEEDEQKNKFHDWGTENITVRTLLKRYQEKKIILPLCQRLYIWNEKQRNSLFDSVIKNLPCGTVIIAEYNGTQYLLDGLQRTTSLMLLSNNKKDFTTEQRKLILDYKITLTVIHDIDDNTMKHYFNLLNSGVALASAVKERSRLSDELNETILKVSSHSFFRTISESANATFNKSHHHELIAMNTLLAVSNIEIGENKAKSLCSKIGENAEIITANTEKAIETINRLAELFEDEDKIEESIIKRSLNANFLSSLVYVMVNNPQYTNEQLISLINRIFAEKKAVKAYSATTTSGAGDCAKCKERVNVLINLLENPMQIKGINETELRNWKENYSEEHDGIFKAYCDKSIFVDIAELSKEELQALYIAEKEGKFENWDSIIKNAYEVLEDEIA